MDLKMIKINRIKERKRIKKVIIEEMRIVNQEKSKMNMTIE